MGNNSSSVLQSDSTTFSPTISNIPFNLDISALKQKLTELLEYHENLRTVYLDARNKASTYKIPMDSEDNEIEKFTNTLTNGNIETITNLFRLGVLKIRIYNQSNTELYIQDNRVFGKIQDKLISNLKNLIDSASPLQTVYSLDTVDDKYVKKQYDNNVSALNDIIVRILLYKYNIILNNYIINLYTIYAQSQIEVFEAEILKAKKQSEFTTVQKLLKELLQNAKVNDSNLKIDKHLSDIHNNIRKVQVGGNSLDVQVRNVERISDLLNRYAALYEESVTKTTKFFELMSNMIDTKTSQIIEKYNKANATVYNSNIRNALSSLEKKVTTNKIRYLSEQDFSDFINKSNLNDNDKQTLLQLLQIATLESNASQFGESLMRSF